MAIRDSITLQKGYSLQLFSTVDAVDVKNWHRLTEAASLFLSLDYLKGLELSWPKNHCFVYVIVYKDNNPLAALYFQAIDLTTLKIGSVIHAEPYGKFLKLVSDKITKSLINPSKGRAKWLLVNGNMCSSGEFGVATHPGNKLTLSKLFPEIIKKVSLFIEDRGEVSVYLLKDFSFEDDYLASVMKEENYIRFVMDPVMMMSLDPDWKSFNDYQDALSSKYRLRTSNVMEKLAGLKLCELNCSDIKKFSSKLDLLYQQVIGKSPVRIIHPDINYIYHLKEHLAGAFSVQCWFLNEEPVAFYTALISKDETDAHHIGIDYHFNKSYALYQNILYSLVGDAIKRRSVRLNFGRTAMEMKSTVGAIPFNYAAYIKLSSKVMNHLLRPFIPAQPPSGWVQRYPFRKVEGGKS